MLSKKDLKRWKQKSKVKGWKKSKKHKKLELIIFVGIFFIAVFSIFKLYKGVEDSKRNTVYAAKEFPKIDYILNTDGKSITVIPGIVRGSLDRMIVKDDFYVEFFGWAFDVKNSQLPETILISYNGENIYKGKTNLKRPDVAKNLGKTALESGFYVKLPLKIFKGKEIDFNKLRLFAISNGIASELIYSKSVRAIRKKTAVKGKNTAVINPEPVYTQNAINASKEGYITYSNGLKIPLDRNAMRGFLEEMNLKNNNKLELSGWAIDLRNPLLSVVIIITYKGENIYWGQNNVNRSDIAKKFGNVPLRSGFGFELPLKMFKVDKLNTSELRVFAFSNGVATELNYKMRN